MKPTSPYVDIVAHGTHDELLESREYHAKLAKLSFTADKIPMASGSNARHREITP